MLRTTKPPKCKECRRRLEQLRPGQVVHAECAEAYVLKLRAKKASAAKKQERTNVKTRKEAAKTIPKLIKEAQVAFNAFIRQRDRHRDCICCSRPLGDGEVGGSYDCGHYRSTGSASHLRFDPRNAHAQRKQCNRWGAGRAVDYRIGLIARIGLAAVESLEADNAPRKWTRDELIGIRETYKQKLKELQKEMA